MDPIRSYDVKEDEDRLQLRVDMRPLGRHYLFKDVPELKKEDLKVSVEGSTLVITVEGKKKVDFSGANKFVQGIYLPEAVFDLAGVKVDMNDGLLKVVVPKLKREACHVQIE